MTQPAQNGLPGDRLPFVFLPPAFDEATGQAALRFSYADMSFEEILDFGGPETPLPPARRSALRRALALMNVAAGISYYKAFLSPQTDGAGLDQNAARFFDTFYRDGLAELALRNNVALPSPPLFAGTSTVAAFESIPLSPRALVMIGGGKDSLVTLEALKATGENITLFAVNPAAPIRDCLARAGLPSRIVRRTIDPKLFELNKQGVYNGHVPITGIISFIAVVTALIHDYQSIIVSNERSASQPTVGDANHQYSKSLAFERDFQNLISAQVTDSLSYFSFLRPLSELHIAQLFARTKSYDDIFTSCNKAYSVTRPMTDRRWCADCPKCRFVFLALATACSPQRLADIFGVNILDRADQTDGFRELSGLLGHKPWECVGEILESASALYALSQKPEWQKAAVIRALAPELVDRYGTTTLQKAYEEALTPSSDPVLPARYLDILNRYVDVR